SHPEKAAETLAAWVQWLKTDRRANGKVGLVGWSFGAEWAFRTAIAAPVDATVLYVGLILPSPKEVAQLHGPLLGHFAESDPSSRNERCVLQSTLAKAGKSLAAYWYAGDHYFAFSNRPSYDKALADTAWTRTIEFLRANLG